MPSGFAPDQSIANKVVTELHVLVNGAAAGLGMLHLLADLEVRIRLWLLMDCTASIGICKWQGLGKVRHLDVQNLWIRQSVGLGRTFSDNERRPMATPNLESQTNTVGEAYV